MGSIRMAAARGCSVEPATDPMQAEHRQWAGPVVDLSHQSSRQEAQERDRLESCKSRAGKESQGLRDAGGALERKANETRPEPHQTRLHVPCQARAPGLFCPAGPFAPFQLAAFRKRRHLDCSGGRTISAQSARGSPFVPGRLPELIVIIFCSHPFTHSPLLQ